MNPYNKPLHLDCHNDQDRGIVGIIHGLISYHPGLMCLAHVLCRSGLNRHIHFVLRRLCNINRLRLNTTSTYMTTISDGPYSKWTRTMRIVWTNRYKHNRITPFFSPQILPLLSSQKATSLQYPLCTSYPPLLPFPLNSTLYLYGGAHPSLLLSVSHHHTHPRSANYMFPKLPSFSISSKITRNTTMRPHVQAHIDAAVAQQRHIIWQTFFFLLFGFGVSLWLFERSGWWRRERGVVVEQREEETDESRGENEYSEWMRAGKCVCFYALRGVW